MPRVFGRVPGKSSAENVLKLAYDVNASTAARPCYDPPVIIRLSFLLSGLLLASPVLALPPAKVVTPTTDDTPVTCHALIVGGGPDVASNAAQIEAHVRFVVSLLPSGVKPLVLFADGKTDQASVSYADASVEADAERALNILLADHDAEEPVLTRVPTLGVPLHGPAHLKEFHRALAQISGQAATKPTSTLLLYFAGHGTQDEDDARNTHYDMWDGDALKVTTLAEEVARLPRQTPVVLVMAQCFSGAFADVLFKGADPKATPIEQNLVGFFSTRKDREAAGCSYATERADFQDFSSYYFGALSGHDRFGDAVTDADYDKDGKVSLHEAFCYALIHDKSADTPVCTSDVFLLRKALQPNATIYVAPYREVWQAGTPAQRAALDALSGQLDLNGETRALDAFDRLTYGDPVGDATLLHRQSEEKEKLRALRLQMLGPLLARWPALRWNDATSDEFQKASDGATADLTKDEGSRRALLAAGEAQERADEAVEKQEAALLRFVTVYEHIVEASVLWEKGVPETKRQFERLWKAEQSTLALPDSR